MATRPAGRRRFQLIAIAAGVGVLLVLPVSWEVGWLRTAKPAAPEPVIERQARRFVSLALTLGRIAPAEVDSYFGPADLKPVAKSSLAELRADLGDLDADLHQHPHRGRGAADRRRTRLAERTDRLLALVDTMGPVPPLSFDEEARRVYGLAPTRFDPARFVGDRQRLDQLLPGDGLLVERVTAFRGRYVVPPDRRVAVFTHALAECRHRTRQHWRLPAAEHVDVEWTHGVDAAWHRYRGGFRSLLQINSDAVAFLGSAVNVACHEAYPGHHVQFTLADAAAGPGGLPVEDRIVLLRSPAAVVREGAAEFGVTLAFPPADRLAFDRDVLMPLAGLPQADAVRFEQVRELLDQLALAAYPILRDYRDGRLDQASASVALRDQALVASPASLLAFTDAMGAYVAGYTAARDQVRQRVTPGSGGAWSRLRCLLAAADDAPLARAGAMVAPMCNKTISEVKS